MPQTKTTFFVCRPELYDAPRRRNHDAERRATQSGLVFFAIRLAIAAHAIN